MRRNSFKDKNTRLTFSQCLIFFKHFIFCRRIPTPLRVGLGIGTLTLIVVFQNCGRGFEVSPSLFKDLSSTSSPGPLPSNTSPDLQAKAMTILSTNCKDCHNTQALGGLGQILDVNSLIQTKFIIPGDANASRLYSAIATNRMPPSYSLSQDDKNVISSWIVSLGAPPASGPSPQPTPMAGATPSVPADLSFAMSISIEPLPFRVRLAKLANILGSSTSPSLSQIQQNNLLLGDYDYYQGVIPKYSFETNDMKTWMTSVEPICGSTELSSKYAWPTGAGAFAQAALGRPLNATETSVVQDVNGLSTTAAEKFKVFCITLLTSLEFISK